MLTRFTYLLFLITIPVIAQTEPPQESTLALPVRLERAFLQALVNEEIPPEIHETGSDRISGKEDFWPKDIEWSVGYDWWADFQRKEITLTLGQNELKATIPLTGTAQVRTHSYGVHETVDITGSILITTQLDLGSDWQLNPVSKLDLEISRADMEIGFKVGPINLRKTISLRGVIKNAAEKELREKAKDLDKELASLDLKSEIAKLWQELHQPIPLVEDPMLYLVIAPTAIRYGGFRAQQDALVVDLGLDAHTTVQTGEAPSAQQPSPLPNLQKTLAKPHFHFTVPLNISHAELTEQATPHVKGYTHTFKGGNRVTVQGLDLTGTGDRLDVDLEIEASTTITDFDGKLQMSGRPVYNPKTQTLSIENFAMDLETRNILAKGAAWFLIPKFRQELQKKLNWDFAQNIQKAVGEANQRLKNLKLDDGIYLKANLNPPKLTSHHFDESGLHLTLQLTGGASLHITPDFKP